MSEIEGQERHTAQTVKAVAPLLIVNALAVYGQLAYALDHIAPQSWAMPARIALAVGFAMAVESVALYVGWHAHDALLLKSHATARQLRRWSFLIAAAVAAMNYAHFAGTDLRPTAAACAFGLLSLLSPWMWGLHTRRAARLQLLKERRVDEAGAEFSSERRRAFPIRTWQARRWSIDHGVTDPREAWEGYNAERNARRAAQAPVIVEAQVEAAVEQIMTPPALPALPTQRRPREVATTSGRVAQWDVEKAVAMILVDAVDADIMSATGASPKSLQRTRRCVRMLTSGVSVQEAVERVPMSPAGVQRIKDAMDAVQAA